MIELLKDIDWRKHIVGLTLFCAAFVFFIVSFFFYLDELALLNKFVNQSHQQQSINFSADESRRTLEANLPQYRLEQEKGLVGEAQRLQWIETTQSLSSELNIPLIEYTLDITSKVDEINNPYWHPELELEGTSMTLEIDLFHEGDFLKVMNALALKSNGVFSIEKCSLVLNPSAEEDVAALAGIKSRCTLLWYSLSDITKDWENEEV